MTLEVGSFINDLVATNPLATDPVGQGDDHLRLIKSCVLATLPNMGGIFSQVRSLDVATSLSSTWNTSLIVTSASATTTVILTLPPAASITTGFTLSFFTLGSANISLLPSGAASINGAGSFAIPERNYAVAVYQGASVWRAMTIPNGISGSAFGGDVTVSGALSVSGATVLNNLSVSGVAVLNGAVTMNTTLSVSGIATFKSGISVSGVAILNGAVTMNGALTVSANATFSSGISVSGAAHFNTTVSIGGAATLAGTLTVSGATAFLGILSVSGAAHFKTTVSIGGAATLASTLSVSGASHFNTTVSIGGAATLASTLSVSGAASMLSTFYVAGTTTLSGAVIMNGSLTVSGATVLAGGLSVSGAAAISGNLTLLSNLSVSGASFMSNLTLIGALTVAGTTTLSGTVVLSNGQLKFPASQNASSDVNMLDDYEEGTWTPTVTFAVPGTLNVTYGIQVGRYTKVGNLVQLSWSLTTTVFTPGTASGNFLINGIPFNTVAASNVTGSSGSIGGMTFDAGYTFASVITAAAGSASLLTQECGSNKTPATMTATQWTGAVVGPFFGMTLAYMVT